MKKPRPSKRKGSIVSVKLEGGWVWRCAFDDCAATPDVLPDHIWKLLAGYSKKEDFLKMYLTEDQAINALRNVIKMLKRHIEEFDI
jgi:hypothetical protein